MPVVMRWDYGDERRGRSCEDAFFVESLGNVVERVEPVWIDDLLNSPEKLVARVNEAIDRVRPDLLFFVPFRDEFSPAALDAMRSRVPTLAWFSDDDWRFDSYTRRLAPHYSHVCTTDPFSVAKYRSIGIDPVVTGWAGQLIGPDQGPAKSPTDYDHDVAFVGGLDRYRHWFLSRLRAAGIHVEHFGAGSPNGRISFEEMESVFRRSRINLNLSNSRSHDLRFVFASPANLALYLRSRKRTEQVKARNFEIPLAGGCELTNYVPGIERHFVVGREVAAYATVEDCIRQVEHLLTNDEERMAIARAGYLRASAEHTYEQRFARILASVWPS